MKRKGISRDGPGAIGKNKIVMLRTRPGEVDKGKIGSLPGSAQTMVNQNLQWKENEKNSLAFIIEHRRAKDLVEEMEKTPLEKIVGERRSHIDEITYLERIIEDRKEQDRIMELQKLPIELIVEARRKYEDNLSFLDSIIEERKKQERETSISARDTVVGERRSHVDEKTDLDSIIDMRRGDARAAE
ncbi:MAG: hypothetical protein JXA07_11120 [Spirochaetes bacterium]|nr:hypothetical protein [Spirochaetota bacterium]